MVIHSQGVSPMELSKMYIPLKVFVIRIAICVCQLDESKDPNQAKLLPEELFVALECCLDDKHEQVQRAAAFALYTLERPVAKVNFDKTDK